MCVCVCDKEREREKRKSYSKHVHIQAKLSLAIIIRMCIHTITLRWSLWTFSVPAGTLVLKPKGGGREREKE